MRNEVTIPLSKDTFGLDVAFFMVIQGRRYFMYSVKVLRWETGFLFLSCSTSALSFGLHSLQEKIGWFIAVRLKLNISLPPPLAFTLQSYSALLTSKARLRCF